MQDTARKKQRPSVLALISQQIQRLAYGGMRWQGAVLMTYMRNFEIMQIMYIMHIMQIMQ